MIETNAQRKGSESEKKKMVNKASSGEIWHGKQWQQDEGLNNERKSQDTVKATEP